MFSTTQLAILAILSENPQKEHHLHEIGRILGKSPGVFQRGINSLEQQGWLVSRKVGNLRLFRINENQPFKEFFEFVSKSAGGEARLQKLVGRIPGITCAMIYGSYAKGHMRFDSDIDLLVVVNDHKAEDKLVAGLGTIEKFLGREVNYKIYDEKNFNFKRKSKDPFLSEVLSGEYNLLKGVL